MDGKSVVISNSEFLTDLDGSVGYYCSTYSLNPGLAHIFKWLSAIATRYESYKFQQLKVVFHSSVGAATAGTIAMAVDFDAADPAPLSFQDIMSYAGAVSNNVWRFPVYDCRAGNLGKFTKDHFVRVAPLTSNLDIKTYDIGNLHIVTRGMAGTTTVGYVTLDYVVRLTTPQLQSNVNGVGLLSYSGTETSPLNSTSVEGTLLGKHDANSISLNQAGTYWLEGSQDYGNDSIYMNIANMLVDFYTNPNLSIIHDASRVTSNGSYFRFLLSVLSPTHFGLNFNTYLGQAKGHWLMTHLASLASVSLSPSSTGFCGGWAQEAGRITNAATAHGIISQGITNDIIDIEPPPAQQGCFFEVSFWASAGAGLNAITIAANTNCTVDYLKTSVNAAGTEAIAIARVKMTVSASSNCLIDVTTNLGAGVTESQVRACLATPSYSIPV